MGFITFFEVLESSVKKMGTRVAVSFCKSDKYAKGAIHKYNSILRPHERN